jgi:DNA recombination-dependent growth factor C
VSTGTAAAMSDDGVVASVIHLIKQNKIKPNKSNTITKEKHFELRFKAKKHFLKDAILLELFPRGTTRDTLGQTFDQVGLPNNVVAYYITKRNTYAL